MSKEAMKLALEALKQIDEAMPFPVAKLAQAALREALAEQPAQQEDGPINEGWQITVANGHSGYGVYAHMKDYPEEGAVLVQMIEQPAQQEPADTTKIAAQILTYLGFSQDESIHPGADRRRDTVAMMIENASLPSVLAEQPAQQAPVGIVSNSKQFYEIQNAIGLMKIEDEITNYGNFKVAIQALEEMLQPAQPQQKPVLQEIEQYRLQMAGISTAAIGYWKEGDGIHPDYDTVALRDVAKLYAKYDELYREQPAQRNPLNLDELKALWNSQADHMNQWDELGIDEIVAFAQAAHNIKEQS